MSLHYPTDPTITYSIPYWVCFYRREYTGFDYMRAKRDAETLGECVIQLPLPKVNVGTQTYISYLNADRKTGRLMNNLMAGNWGQVLGEVSGFQALVDLFGSPYMGGGLVETDMTDTTFSGVQKRGYKFQYEFISYTPNDVQSLNTLIDYLHLHSLPQVDSVMSATRMHLPDIWDFSVMTLDSVDVTNDFYNHPKSCFITNVHSDAGNQIASMKNEQSNTIVPGSIRRLLSFDLIELEPVFRGISDQPKYATQGNTILSRSEASVKQENLSSTVKGK